MQPENRQTQPRARRFQALALSGGGFRGLYTAKVIADLEQSMGGAPFATRFDLIAGTSIGGILALALALEIPAARIVKLFQEHGGEIFAKRFSMGGLLRSPYSTDRLRELLQQDDLFGNHLLGACKHPVIVPAINYTTGQAVVFKTAHHSTLRRDYLMPLVDVALATSAAPSYFPRHLYDHKQYVDGGLFANAPGMLALHEATEFLDAEIGNVHLLSIGTMSSSYTVDPRRAPTGGAFDWGGWWPLNMPKRLFGLTISAQEGVTANMLRHRLGSRFVMVDDLLTDERARAVQLDSTDQYAQQILLGTASDRSKHCLGDPNVQAILEHSPSEPVFFHGEKSPKGSTSSC
ncbi:MAG: CBASS cGAMP-activated phospholipase [Hylemonella sp.]|uniref:CBASS cGAMP-activated phospholipase n=1 Tax=Hylemonella sp. TaxID=2066020 RepID=UPI003918A3B7